MTAETAVRTVPTSAPTASAPSALPAAFAGAWQIWSIATAAYVVAILNRSSLAVAGLAATDRFGISSAQLATFTMLQLLVYAGMQVPVGLMVDRFGSRAVMLTGSVLLLAGPLTFAFADSYRVALVARFLVGLGDAMTFICALRLVNAWFAPRRVPVLVQMTGLVGQFGAIAAAIPMAWALSRFGWTTAYLAPTVVGLVVTCLLAVVIHDAPGRRRLRGPSLSFTAIRSSLHASWQHPGTKLGFWVHFTTGFSPTVFALLWGYPFLVRGEGVSAGTAATLLTCVVLIQVVAAPTLGWLMSRVPYHRSTMALWIIGAIVVAWTSVLAYPGQAPVWLLAVLVVVIGVGGPASMIGFDLARTSNPMQRLASATGIINQGNFSAALILVVVIGFVLDVVSGSGDHAAFGWAMSTQYVFWALGVLQIVRYRRRARTLAAHPEAD